MANKKEKAVFFVGIKDPVEIRRGILESSKDLVQSLQRFENFQALRAEKSQRTKELVTAIRSAQRLMSKLKKSLPETKLRINLAHEKEVQEKAEDKKAKKVKKEPLPKEEKISKRELSEIERLEQELGDIEQKLKNLN